MLEALLDAVAATMMLAGYGGSKRDTLFEKEKNTVPILCVCQKSVSSNSET